MSGDKIRGTSCLVANNGTESKDFRDDPVRVLFFEHVADELANASVDGGDLLGREGCSFIVGGGLLGEEFGDRAGNLCHGGSRCCRCHSGKELMFYNH